MIISNNYANRYINVNEMNLNGLYLKGYF